MKMKDSQDDLELKVQNANRKFYESTALAYDQIDTRRKKLRHPWLYTVLKEIRQRVKKPSATILDIGSGSGFLLKHAKDLFERKIALDISPLMLEQISITNCEKLVGTCEKIPLDNSSVDVVSAFATLHHIYSPEKVFQEAHRVLQPGGFFYSDHDIESSFVTNWKIPLKIYRAFFDHEKSYLKERPELSHEDYELSEFHGNRGISGKNSFETLEKCGFQPIQITYHWQGLLPIEFPWKIRGLSPLLRIIAQKRH